MTDAALKRRLAKLQSILEVAKAMTAERNLDRLLALIIDEAAKVAEADRCSIFLVDRDKRELWSKVAHGTQEIRIPLGTGIAGAVAASGEAVRIADAYADPRFNQQVDARDGLPDPLHPLRADAEHEGARSSASCRRSTGATAPSPRRTRSCSWRSAARPRAPSRTRCSTRRSSGSSRGS